MKTVKWQILMNTPSDDGNVSSEIEETPPEEMTDQEMRDAGFFLVENVLKHRYKQGWRFLVKWKGWSVAESTWEPI